MTSFKREAAASLLLLLGCSGSGGAARRETDALRAEVQALRKDNEELSRKVEALAGRVEVISTRLARPPQREDRESPAPIVPPDLAVVHMEPAKAGRTAPPISTAVPIADPGQDAIPAKRAGHDEIGREAEAELQRARKKSGAARAHALEGFAARYPRHPSADNALAEAAAAYADAGKVEAACELARRCVRDYPAGDAMSDALERLAWCESRRGSPEAERRVLERLVSEFPRTPAAERAGARLATLSGRSGDTPAAPARSGP